MICRYHHFLRLIFSAIYWTPSAHGLTLTSYQARGLDSLPMSLLSLMAKGAQLLSFGSLKQYYLFSL
jgi:hypothetical protein